MLRRQDLEVLEGGRGVSSGSEAILADVAHEVLAPVWTLASVGGALRRRRARLTAREEQLLDAVERSTARVARTLGGVLDLAEAAGVPLDPRPADLREICALAVAELREVGEEGEVAFEGEGDLRGTWDAERLAQATSYLVELALAGSRPGAPVRLRAHGEAGDVLIRVEHDTFAREAGSAGLDVHFGSELRAGPEHGFRAALARRIVAQHGGSLARFVARRSTSYVAVLPRGPLPDAI